MGTVPIVAHSKPCAASMPRRPVWPGVIRFVAAQIPTHGDERFAAEECVDLVYYHDPDLVSSLL